MIQYESAMYDQYILMHGDELMHHGVKGMKWGVRRYQNPDGSLTSEGKMATKGQLKRAARKEVRARYKLLGKKTKWYKKLGSRYQDKRAAVRLGVNSEYQKALASKAKEGSRKQTKANARSFNSKQLSKYLDNRSKLKFSERVGENLFNHRLNATKLKTLKGKDTTYAKERVKYMLKSMAANTAAAGVAAGAGALAYKYTKKRR